jgi:general secretion pathway protein D
VATSRRGDARGVAGRRRREGVDVRRVTTSWVVILVSALLVTGCANRSYKRGLDAMRAMDWDAAVAYFTKAVQDSPDRAEYRIQLERAMIEASRVHFDRARSFEAADNLEGAVLEYRKTVEYDPSNRQAMLKAAELDRVLRDRAEAARPKPAIEGLRERARQQSQPPLINPASRAPISMKFEQATTQDILKAIGDATGINIAFERDFRPQTTSIQLDDVTLEEALTQVLTLNQLWYKVINAKTILIIPDTQQKRAQYEDQVVRTFYISHADPQELSQSLSLLTRIAGVAVPPVVSVSKTNNTITVRGTRGMVDIIDSIIRANDKPRAEIVIDVEILEVNRTRAKEYGLNLSQYQIGTIFSPETAPDADGGSPPFNLNTITRGISAADFYMTVPSAVVKFHGVGLDDAADRETAVAGHRGHEAHAESRRRDSGAVDDVPALCDGRRREQSADVVHLPIGGCQRRDDAAGHV